jgi:hypothetical protein
MRRALGDAKGKTARQVLDDLLRALDGFELKDDATLLVIRQLELDGAEAHREVTPPGATNRAPAH